MTFFSRHRFLLAALFGGVGVVAAVALWLFQSAGSTSPRCDGGPFPDVRFTDVTDAAGLRFRHFNGAAGRKLLPETMGSGVAVLDYDRDGRPDLFFANSRPWPGHPDPPGGRPTQALYRNQGDGTFTDVTAAAGLDETLYGMGAAIGDFDDDGWSDLLVTAVGGSRLFRNLGGKRFEDVTDRAGLPVGSLPDVPADEFHKWDEPIPWPASATFHDYDRDGRLDLFVCSYVTWSPAHDLGVNAVLPGGRRAYVPPTQFPGAHCLLYRNLGGGRFEDVSATAGVQVSDPVGRGGAPEPIGKALGVVLCDPDGDGWPDLIVANDTVRNFFFRNVPSSDGGRRFEEIGLTANVAYAEGRPRGGMGIDYAEVRPGQPAAVIANFTNEPNTLLEIGSASPLLFRDAAATAGLAGPSRGPMKFGALFFDYDLDGRNDLLTCNGHLEPDIALSQSHQSHPQPAQFYRNTGQLFEPVSEANAGPDLFRPLVGRGCAYLDYDGDGDLDVVLMENNGRARLLRNDNRTGNNWLRLALEGGGIGAEVTVEAGGVTRRWHVAGARGYLSQSEGIVTIGLGRVTKADKVTVRWPGKEDGTRTWTDLPTGRVHRLTRKE